MATGQPDQPQDPAGEPPAGPASSDDDASSDDNPPAAPPAEPPQGGDPGGPTVPAPPAATAAAAPPPLAPQRRWPTVTVVVINLDARDELAACLASVDAQDYPAEHVELLVVDNASTDGSADMVRADFPHARLIENDANAGFAPAVNQAAELAGGAYLALLNNDATAERAWLRAAVDTMENEQAVGCVGSKVLRDDGVTLDYAGGEMAFYGHGFPRGSQQPDDGDDRARRTLFASGSALVTRTRLFRDVGGFDASYFAFFEDVDYGWRLWLYGHEVVYVPASLVYHRHHATIARFGYPRERYLLERNALATIFKNYGDDRLARILPASLLLAIARGLDDDELDLPDFSIYADAPVLESVELPPLSAAHLAAVRDFARSLDDLAAKREVVQARRRRGDRAVMRLFGQSLRPNVVRSDFLDAFEQTVRAFDLNDHARPRSHVLIVTQDAIGERMAGPAIRCWEMAKLLAATHEVVLASTQRADLTHASFTSTVVTDHNIDELLAPAEVVVFQGFVMHQFPQIEAFDGHVLVDIYDPFHLEGLNLRKQEVPAERWATAKSDVDVLNDQLARADFMVCASEKQRDFWLGQLASIGRINPATFDTDESLRALLDVAPFGLPSEPPAKTEPVLRGVVDGIAPDDFVLLWGGGVYNWFDPLTLVRAVARLADEDACVKLFFMGAAHPNAAVPRMAMAAAARELAVELGVADRHVFFNDGWIPYERRADWLLEADVGVSTHFEHIETAFSYRTRILDYLWANLPVLCTHGDSLSQLVTSYGLGVTVPPEDVDAVAQGIRWLRDDPDFYAAVQANVAALAPEMTWDKALAPIMEFCNNPQPAPDRRGTARRYVAGRGVTLTKPPWYYARRFVDYTRQAGPRTALLHARNFVRQRLR
jgi:GT2 family glycosyltransferase